MPCATSVRSGVRFKHIIADTDPFLLFCLLDDLILHKSRNESGQKTIVEYLT
jgi:hypothetical protein